MKKIERTKHENEVKEETTNVVSLMWKGPIEGSWDTSTWHLWSTDQYRIYRFTSKYNEKTNFGACYREIQPSGTTSWLPVRTGKQGPSYPAYFTTLEEAIDEIEKTIAEAEKVVGETNKKEVLAEARKNGLHVPHKQPEKVKEKDSSTVLKIRKPKTQTPLRPKRDVDRFGSRLGTICSRVNEFLNGTPATEKAIREKAEVGNSVLYHLDMLVRLDLLSYKKGEGYYISRDQENKSASDEE